MILIAVDFAARIAALQDSFRVIASTYRCRTTSTNSAANYLWAARVPPPDKRARPVEDDWDDWDEARAVALLIDAAPCLHPASRTAIPEEIERC